MKTYNYRKTGKTFDPNKPKRPKTAYLLFLDDYRKGQQKFGKDQLKMAGEEWRKMSAENKKTYIQSAFLELMKYNEKMFEYTNSSEYKRIQEDRERWESEMEAFNNRSTGKLVDPNKPKKPKSAYSLFLDDCRKGQQNFGRDQLKIAGEEWRKMSADNKKSYIQSSCLELMKYNEKMFEYTNSVKDKVFPSLESLFPPEPESCSKGTMTSMAKVIDKDGGEQCVEISQPANRRKEADSYFNEIKQEPVEQDENPKDVYIVQTTNVSKPGISLLSSHHKNV